MILLRMYGMALDEQKTEKLDSLFSELATHLRPFVAPTLAAQAEVFGLKPSSIQPTRSVAIAEALKEGGVVDSEIVVVCSKTQSQVLRAPSRSIIEELTGRGLKCVCGRALSDASAIPLRGRPVGRNRAVVGYTTGEHADQRRLCKHWYGKQ